MKRIIFIEGDNYDERIKRMNWYGSLSDTLVLSFTKEIDDKPNVDRQIIMEVTDKFVSNALDRLNEYENIVIFDGNSYLLDTFKIADSNLVIEREIFLKA